MKPIQYILGFAFIFIIVFYFKRIRSHLLDRLILMLAMGLGILFIAWPELATVVANFVGVGRGADLITYLGLVSLFFLYLTLVTEVRNLNERLTLLIRALAIQNAQTPEAAPTQKSGPAKEPADSAGNE